MSVSAGDPPNRAMYLSMNARYSRCRRVGRGPRDQDPSGSSGCRTLAVTPSPSRRTTSVDPPLK